MQLFRTSMLLALSAVLVVVLGSLTWRDEEPKRPTPRPVRDGEAEVAWVAPATGTGGWERFVAAARRCGGRLGAEFPGIAVDDHKAFPAQTTAIPEVAVTWPAAGGDGPARRVVFRWYKLTGNWSVGSWIEALLGRNPPPVAILGGGNSFWGRELAWELRNRTERLPESIRPLLLLTTATADRVEVPADGGKGGDSSETVSVPLGDLYPGRTFRFCFTNRQMAQAVSRFVWTKNELRPDSDRFSTVQWEDDAYSRNLVEGFLDASAHEVRQQAQETVLLRVWVGNVGRLAVGFPPVVYGLGLARREAADAGLATPPLEPVRVESSVGSFLEPNVYEADAVGSLLEMLTPPPGEAAPKKPRRHLIVVAGQAGPTRRLLRYLAQSDPVTARHFVVATGDGLSFNNVYRDRSVAWPVLELPYSLVFFSHHNPIDAAAGFVPLDTGVSAADGTGGPGASGTEDLLLDAGMVEALARAWPASPPPDGTAAGLARGLARLRWTPKGLFLGRPGDPHSIRLFRPDGTRESGTGEQIVYLRPTFQETRVLPEATLQVWAWEASTGEAADLPPSETLGPRSRSWRLTGELKVVYDEPRTRGGPSHVGN